MIRSHKEFGALKDEAFRDRYYKALNHLLQDLEYTVIACAIRLDDHVAAHGEEAADPYTYSLDILVERFCDELGDELDAGFICAEMRSAGLDRELQAAWQRLCRDGTGNLPASEIDARIVHFTLKDKKPNIACMQLADLVVTPIGRAILGTLPHHRYQVRWEVIESKLRRVGNTYEGHGLVIRP